MGRAPQRSDAELRDDALACYRAALAAVEPRAIVREALARRELTAEGRIVVAAIGKAAVRMTEGALDALGDRVERGVVIAPVETEALPERFAVYVGGHPLPNAEGVAGARALRELAEGLGGGDLLLALISGGGSALMTLPPDGVSLEEVQRTTDVVLRSGASIVELNALRKHLDQLKGGRLARAVAPAALVGLVLSDVVGDPLDAIASGPATPDPTTFQDVIEILDRYGVRDALPASVRAHLARGVAGTEDESPKAEDDCFDRVEVAVVGNNVRAAEAARKEASRRGYDAKILSTALIGEASEVGRELARRAARIEPGDRPVAVVAAGETTVTVRGGGRGGRNQELALGAAIELDGTAGVLVASLGTDGIDGPTDAAGAYALGDSVARARALGVDAEERLAENDSYHFFDPLGDLVRTGPSGTNVMDLQIALSV